MGTKRRRGGVGGMEENTMAILDTSCFSKSTQHIADDRLSFLEAVRSDCLVPENASAPTNNMYKAIFQILKVENSLYLIMSSYQLLLELDKRFPQVYLSPAKKSESSSPSSLPCNELVVVEEAWSPFSFGTDVSSSEKEDHDKTSGSLDATAFHLLIEDLAKVPDDANTETLRNMLLFQYLVSVLEGDFTHRNLSFKESSEWITLRESLLNKILVSRKIIYKGLVKNCLSTMCQLSQFSMDCSHELTPHVTESNQMALVIALPELVRRTSVSVQKFLSMIIELDASKKVADMGGLTTRADGVRTPAMEIILEELTYDKNILFPFFQALDKPKLKLDIILQYFQKYMPKFRTYARTRRSNSSSTDNSTFGGVLKCFSNGNNTKSIIKKINTEIAQLLLAHAFMAYISLPAQHSSESKEDIADNSLSEICKNLISAFTCLKNIDQRIAILGFEKEALFTAAIMMRGNSRV